jgi:hypothetical protein
MLWTSFAAVCLPAGVSVVHPTRPQIMSPLFPDHNDRDGGIAIGVNRVVSVPAVFGPARPQPVSPRTTSVRHALRWGFT